MVDSHTFSGSIHSQAGGVLFQYVEGRFAIHITNGDWKGEFTILSGESPLIGLRQFGSIIIDQVKRAEILMCDTDGGAKMAFEGSGAPPE